MRVKNLMRNSFFGMFGQVVLIGFGFVCQRVLNVKLGEALVGLNSVISNILSILSVTELGIATAVVYNLYRALAAQDEQEIVGLMNLYRKAYYVFAAIITALGLGVMPFLQLFLKDNPFTPEYVRLVYFLWLARTVAAYLLSYRRSILIADQQEYVVSIASLLANVLDYSVIILIVNYTGDFVLPLALNILIDSVSNVWISAYVNRKYPFLRRLRKEPLDKNLRRKVFDNVKNIFASHLADKLLVATDNVIISSFISVAFAGLYNNYCLITNALTNIARALSGAIQPSVGTMFVEDHKQGGQLLRVVTFLFFLFASSTACTVYTVINPFVRDVWLGDRYLMELSVVALYVINYFLLILSLPVTMVMGVTGLFDKERNIALLSAACNMFLSIGLVRVCGIYGVLLGTLVAYVMQVSYRVHVFHHVYLGVSMRVYVSDLLQYLVLGFGETVLVSRLAERIYRPGSIMHILLLAVFAAGLPFVLNLLLYFKSWRMRSILKLFRHKNETTEKHMKKIAFFSGDITGNGGTERVGTLIANALAEQGRYEVFFISLAQERETTTFPLSDKITRDVLAQQRILPGVGYLSLIPRLKTYVKQKKIDLIIDIDSVLDVLSLPVKWMTGVRVISWEHFYYYDVRGTWYRRPIRRLTTRFADAIVTLTEQDRGYYLENSADPGKVHAIHNPVYDMPAGEVRHVHAQNKKEIFSAGALSQIKGFIQVPLIAKYVKERYPKLDFIWRIAGEGAMRAEIERRIVACGVQDEVKLLGQMEDMRPLYDQAEIYVMTSEREGLPMVLLEAKQYGLPIVSYDIRTGPSEVIEDGVNGYLILFTGDEQNDASAMADAIGRLLTDEKLYNSFAQHTKDHMEDFLLERVLEQWEELIRRIAG